MTSLEIRNLLHRGRRFEAPYCNLYFLPTPSAPRIACIVGKKVHRLAHVRHRYQRLLREALRSAIRSGVKYDMVVVAKPEILNLKKLDEIQHVLEPHFKNLV